MIAPFKSSFRYQNVPDGRHAANARRSWLKRKHPHVSLRNWDAAQELRKVQKVVSGEAARRISTVVDILVAG